MSANSSATSRDPSSNPTMVLHNPNNWHWVNKDTSEWARNYLEQNLVGVSAAEKDVSAKITKINSMDGDVDVSQRKGKVITLFDVKVQLEYEGKTADDEEVSGTISIPEVAHDTEEDEYVVRSLCRLPPKSHLQWLRCGETLV